MEWDFRHKDFIKLKNNHRAFAFDIKLLAFGFGYYIIKWLGF